MIVRLWSLLAAAAWLVAASSQARNPLQFLSIVEDASIQTRTHRVTALSNFDLHFSLYDGHRRIKLSLEPNHDVISHDLHIEYQGDDGTIEHREKVDRLSHKVFKGTAFQQTKDGNWTSTGWARITILNDGINPFFEGAFTVDRDSHHIQSQSSYMATKHEEDPGIEARKDEIMVVWRDSDISRGPIHSDLRRRGYDDQSCYANTLEFNTRLDHPVFRTMLKRSDNHWGVMPIGSMFGRRQIDSQPGGNSAGVDLASTIGQSAGCPTTRKVALVGVATDCGYTASFGGNHSATSQNVINVMNMASQVWESTFQISLGLQSLRVLSPNCPGTPQAATPWNQGCSSSLDIQSRLNLFSAWRGTLDDNNSHWTMMTSCNTGTAVGLAWLGMACVQTAQSSGSNGANETVSGANVVARTATEWQVVAHETGHTFGAVHDCTSQTCGDAAYVNSQQCCPYSTSACYDSNTADPPHIMAPSSSDGITSFSQCTIGNVCSAIGRNAVDTSCLTSNKNVALVTGQQCGNGIVEDGEDCDCGGTAGCQGNTCCDPQSCKFLPGAVCDDANEDCCNNCQLSSKETICRNSSSVCDPAERCTGTSAICPADVTSPDGQSCTTSDGQDAQCASGQCTSRDLQCRTIMASFISGANDTYACDSQTCMISCASPAFGANSCYGLQQNFLDGTPCGGGGHCKNGNCEGSTFGGEISSWVDDHKALVIGIASAVGGILLLAVLSCFWRCFRGRKRRAVARQNNTGPRPAGGSWYGPPPPPALMHGAAQPSPQMQQTRAVSQPRDVELQQQAWQRAQQAAWESGWRPPHSQTSARMSGPPSPMVHSGRDSPVTPIGGPATPTSPLGQNSSIYGQGIIGNFHRPPPPPPPPAHTYQYGSSGVRYA